MRLVAEIAHLGHGHEYITRRYVDQTKLPAPVTTRKCDHSAGTGHRAERLLGPDPPFGLAARLLFAPLLARAAKLLDVGFVDAHVVPSPL